MNSTTRDATIFEAARLFVDEGVSATEISTRLDISRQSVYSFLAEARERGFLRMVPPENQELAKRIISRFALKQNEVTVVDVGDVGTNAATAGIDQLASESAGEYVASAAADIAVRLILEIIRDDAKKDVVRIGLGPGRATLDFSKQLSVRLRSSPLPAKLRLIAISSSCPATQPEFTSTSFFNLFPRESLAGCVGLFSDTLVSQEQFQQMSKSLPVGFREAFREKDEIDIVVTAMGAAYDEHDLLMTFLRDDLGREKVERLSKDWVGNVQYRPYTKDGPVAEGPNEKRAVTLFEFKELVNLAKTKQKHVILMARTCGLCRKTRSTALLPLLRNTGMKAWSQLVVDARTARELATK